MPFPTSPSDGDEYTNANGTTYKYDSTDDKWVILNGVAPTYTRVIPCTFILAEQGVTVGVNNVWTQSGVVFHGHNSYASGNFVISYFQLPNDYIADSNFTFTVWSHSPRVDPRVDWQWIADRYVDGVLEANKVTDTGINLACVQNAYVKTEFIITGTDWNAGDMVAVRWYQEDDDSAESTRSTGYSLTITVSTGFGGVVNNPSNLPFAADWDGVTTVPASKNAIYDEFNGALRYNKYAHFIDQKAQSTAGGSVNSGGWRTRVINTTITNNGGFATLASNQITLIAGTYIVHAWCPCFYVNAHQAELWNVTDSTRDIQGTNEVSNPGTGYSSGHSKVFGSITIVDTKVFELRHIVSTSRATDGFGRIVGGGPEQYSTIEIWKVG